MSAASSCPASELIAPQPAVHGDLRAREALALLRRIVAPDLLAHDAARRNRVDGDAEPAHVPREALGPGVDARLGREGGIDVLGLGLASDVDDATPFPLHHARQD